MENVSINMRNCMNQWILYFMRVQCELSSLSLGTSHLALDFTNPTWSVDGSTRDIAAARQRQCKRRMKDMIA